MSDWSKCIMVALALAVAAEVAAQTPPPKPKPKPKPDSTEPQKSGESLPPSKVVATLLVNVDEACELHLNGVVIQSLAAGQSVTIPLPHLGDHFLEAKSVDGLVWSELLTIKEPGQKFVRTALQDARAKRDLERPLGEPVVRDALTWMSRDNRLDVDPRGADAYCERVIFGGFDDWRLPTIDELKGLYDPTVSGRFKIIESIDLSAGLLWSSTHGPLTPAIEGDVLLQGYGFDFSSGSTRRIDYWLREYDPAEFRDLSVRALCVRRSGG